MPNATYLLDENTGAVAETPIVIPIRWRYRLNTTSYLTGTSFDLPTNSTIPHLPGSSTSLGAWNLGGIATPNLQVCKYQNGSGFFTRREFAIMYRPFSMWNYVSISLATGLLMTFANVEIDWEYFLVSLRATNNPTFYEIGGIRFTDSSGNNAVDVVKEGLISLEKINAIFQDTKHAGEEVTVDLMKFSTNINYADYVTPYGPQYPNDRTVFQKVDSYNIKGISGDEAGANFPATVNNLSINTCASNGRSFNMYLQVWVSRKVISEFSSSGGSGGDNVAWVEPKKIQQTPDITSNPQDRIKSDGRRISSNLGGLVNGVNQLSTLYGNSNLPFDSMFLSGANYNSFVSAGGGIVTESGVFPNLDGALYIDKVHLSIEGSTMSVIEVSKFDSTPMLTVGQKIYGYVFDDNHQNKPVFTGYIVSRRRKLNENTQEITYECRDLSYYFNQFYSPSYYVYTPPQIVGQNEKTYDRVLKEILNVAGIPDAIVDLPDVPAPPIEWIYEPLNNILEWSTKYFGKYVSFVDRYGRLNVKATDSGSFIKNIPIPAEGTPVASGDYHVTDTEPILDNSRSRSRILLTGNFEVKELLYSQRWTSYGPVNPVNATTTGFYWYYNNIGFGLTRFFYFVFNSSDQLLDKLLSDPGKSAIVTLAYTPTISQAPISKANLTVTNLYSSLNGSRIIALFDLKQFGEGFLYPGELVNTPYVPGGSQVRGTIDYLFTVQYAIKERSPIQVSIDTGLTGGVEVIRRPEFKKVSGVGLDSVDDTPLMEEYLSQIQGFYKTTYGGKLEKDGLDLDLELLGKVSITGTSLPSIESTNLIVYEIEYDVPNKKTTVDLSNRVYQDLPFFDVVRERSRAMNDTLVKLGQLEKSLLYNQQ